MLNAPLKKLYACLHKGNNETFFASMVDQKGTVSEMRSSYTINQGDVLQMIPVNDDWDGTPFTSGDISGSQQVLEGNVTRAEGRGVFFIRILSFEEQDIANQVRTGQLSKDNLKIETSDAGLIRTIRLQGRIAMESATRIKPFLFAENAAMNLYLLDFTGISYVEKRSINMLYLSLKQAWEASKCLSIIVKTGSSVEEMLQDSKIRDIADIHTDRDEAVTTLLSRNLT